jgi:hypothetical protein
VPVDRHASSLRRERCRFERPAFSPIMRPDRLARQKFSLARPATLGEP